MSAVLFAMPSALVAILAALISILEIEARLHGYGNCGFVSLGIGQFYVHLGIFHILQYKEF